MEEEYTFKVILVGNTGTGKTSILYNFVNGMNDCLNVTPTIGIDFGTKKIVMENNKIKLNLWDTAGLERYRSITRSYFRSIAGAVIVFDLTNRESFNKIPIWKNEIIENSHNKDIQFILVGNKSDLYNKIVVSDYEIEELSYRLKIDFVKTSVINNHNINYIFEKITCKILHSCRNLNKINLIYSNRDTYNDKYGIKYNVNSIDSIESIDNNNEENEGGVCSMCIIS